MAPEVKPAKNSKLPKLPENYFEPVGKGGWPPISTWISSDTRLGLRVLNSWYPETRNRGGCRKVVQVLKTGKGDRW
jgi:hypothetical protein